MKGARTVRAVFTGFFPTIKGININRHVVDGEWCAAVFDFDTTFGTIPMVDSFHVVDGQVMSIRVHYDPALFGGHEQGRAYTPILKLPPGC